MYHRQYRFRISRYNTVYILPSLRNPLETFSFDFIRFQLYLVEMQREKTDELPLNKSHLLDGTLIV